PTITLTPSLTLTPTITNTPSITNTPAIPQDLADQFESIVTPDANSVFSALVFAEEVDENYQPVEPSATFENPLTVIYGTYSYNFMKDGVQWTEMWYR